MNRFFAALAVAFAVLLVADPAEACAVCGAALEKNRNAFIGTTALLTFLPLMLVGGFGFWLRRTIKRRAAEEEAAAQLRHELHKRAAAR